MLISHCAVRERGRETIRKAMVGGLSGGGAPLLRVRHSSVIGHLIRRDFDRFDRRNVDTKAAQLERRFNRALRKILRAIELGSN